MKDIDDISDKSTMRCMVKRSKFALSVLWDKRLWKMMIFGIPLFIFIVTPIMILDGLLLNYIYEIFNIEKTSIIGSIISIFFAIMIIPEFLILGACLSCIPSVIKFMNRIGDWVNV